MQCVTVNADSSITASQVSPDQCAGYLLLSPQEIAQLQPVMTPLSITDGVTISVAILGCWAIAFAFRAVRTSFNQINGDSNG